MQDRKGVLLLSFDIQSLSNEDKRQYREFKKAIERYGYCQIQESLYVRVIKNITFVDDYINKIKMIAPQSSNIAVFQMSMSSFCKVKQLGSSTINLNNIISDFLII